MSSPCIKLQSLIRKFKNLTKEQTDKNKIIVDFQYNLSLDEMTLTTDYLFQSNAKQLHVYDICDKSVQTPGYNTEIKSLPIYISCSTSANTTENELNIMNEISELNDYIDISVNKKGYLNNVFNTELCDETWLINLFIMHTIHANFIVNDNVLVKSLHVGDISALSPYNHYLFNGALPELVNSEWNWLNTNIGFKDNDTNEHISKKYTNNILQLLETSIYSLNNINYIINEVNNKLTKINFLSINYNSENSHALSTSYNSDNPNNNKNDNILNHLHATYAAFIIKLLDINGIVFIKIPNAAEWNTQFLNILLLYGLLFNEMYIFKFNLTTKSMYLLCKNKKKITNETIYKKLVYIIANKDFAPEYNFFSKEIFTLPDIENWLENVLKIVDCDDADSVPFDNILSVINTTLKVNTETFL